jgi:hypothetical protein
LAAIIGFVVASSPDAFSAGVSHVIELPVFRPRDPEIAKPRDESEPETNRGIDGLLTGGGHSYNRELPPTDESPPLAVPKGADPFLHNFEQALKFSSPPDWAADWDIDIGSGFQFPKVESQKLDDHVMAKLDPEVANGLKAYLAKDPITSRLAIDTWRSSSFSNVKDLYRVVELSKQRLPGKNVQIGLFLDPVVFKSSREKIKDAAGNRPLTEVGPDSVIDSYFEGLKGETLLVVGHVERSYFVQRGLDGKITSSFYIPELIARAHTHEVTLIPIGCQSAKTGAPFGFIDNITTDQVADILQTLPADQPKFADLFEAFAKAGELEFNIGDTRTFLEFAIVRPNRPPSTRFRVYNAYPPGAQGSSASGPIINSSLRDGSAAQQFESEIDADSQTFRPWWNRGIMERIWNTLDLIPWVPIGLCGWVGLIFVWPLLSLLTTLKWWYRTNARIKACRILQRGANVVALCSAFLILATVIRVFVFGFIFGVFYLLLIFGILFGNTTQKRS